MLGDTKDQRSWTFWCVLWLTKCLRVAKEGSPLLVFTDWRQLPCLSDAVQAAGWMWNGLVIWNKPSSRPQKGRFRSQCEYVLFASKGKFVKASQACLPGVYSYAVNTAQKIHIASKPVALMADLLKVTISDAVVLDPFMGGSPVGEACIKTGRGYIGIELSEEYFSIAKARLEKTLSDCAGGGGGGGLEVLRN